MGSPVDTEGWPVLSSVHLPYPASQDRSSLAPGSLVNKRATQGCAEVHYDLPLPPEVGWHSGHLDSLAVVHLYHMESEAVDSTDRGHEAARGTIEATTLIHQHLGEADARGSSLGLALVQ